MSREDSNQSESTVTYYCPLTGELMATPVRAGDSQVYERSAIENWFRTGMQHSPITGERVNDQELILQAELQKEIQEHVEHKKNNPAELAGLKAACHELEVLIEEKEELTKNLSSRLEQTDMLTQKSELRLDSEQLKRDKLLQSIEQEESKKQEIQTKIHNQDSAISEIEFQLDCSKMDLKKAKENKDKLLRKLDQMHRLLKSERNKQVKLKEDTRSLQKVNEFAVMDYRKEPGRPSELCFDPGKNYNRGVAAATALSKTKIAFVLNPSAGSRAVSKVMIYDGVRFERELVAHSAQTDLICVLPNGNIAALGTNKNSQGTWLNTSIKIWDSESGLELKEIKNTDSSWPGELRGAVGLQRTRLQADKDRYLLCGIDGHVVLLNYVTGKVEKSLIVNNQGFIANDKVRIKNTHITRLTYPVLLPNGCFATLAYPTYKITIWNKNFTKCIKTLEGGETGNGKLLTVLPDGRLASSGVYSKPADHSIRIWNVETGVCEHVLEGHTAPIQELLLTPNNMLVSWSRDKTLRFWDIETAQCIQEIHVSHDLNHLTILGDGSVVGFKHHVGNVDVISVYSWSFPQLQPTLGYNQNLFRIPRQEATGKIQAVSIGSNHSLFLLDTGKVFACGRDFHGLLGLGRQDYQTATPQPIPFDLPVALVAAGQYFSFLLTEGNQLYAHGRNEHGQLGLGHKRDQSKLVQVQLPFDKKIIAVEVGIHSHVLLLTESGQVYGVGYNAKGELGLGDRQKRYTFEKIDLPEEIVAISAGAKNSLFLGKSGNVYGCGFNKNGTVGCGNNAVFIMKPARTLLDEKVIAISAGYNFSLFLTEARRVYACGNNNYGQLGLGNNNIFNTPQRVPLEESVIAIQSGAHYSKFLTETGAVYTCGYNELGRLGSGNKQKNQNIPLRIPLEETIIAIAPSTYTHTILFTQSGTLYAFGQNDGGELGLGASPKVVITPQQIPPTFYTADHTADTAQIFPRG